MPQTDHITRVKSEGSIYRWEQQNLGWPGHRSFILVEGIEVIVGDRFSRKVQQVHSCHPQVFLDGCFHDAIKEQYGAKVLEEVIASVKARGFGLESLAPLPKAEEHWKNKPRLRAWPSPEAAVPNLKASAAPLSTAARATPPVAATNASRVDVVVPPGCTIDMARFLALKTASGLSAAILQRRLSDSPAIIMSDVARDDALTIQARLTPLGAALSLCAPGAASSAAPSISKAAPAKPKVERKSVGIKRAKPANYQLTVTRLPNKKAPVIKAISTSITHSKKKATTLIHRLPARILVGVSEEEATMIKGKLEAVGAVVRISQVV